MSLLSNKAINESLNKLDGWKLENNSIFKEYELKDFSAAIGFVTQVGIVAEKVDHHPDILINSWNKVKITLSTHSQGGITNKDISLAEKIDNL
ncbi:MAG: 4a-hydroxytetrahydrobiopterin dehydratase [Melioribacteraceae bacterium]|jgi:4a-hydroxytetrahydrobiopterin dehydratase|nr:4a-hydroxytetrahydrobiopterin dehydratase [Melioribacteraceae bacterium]RJP63407.1 MAG: 4a-hydroxytetrahydrobiopterin dehydratase [Ignavibacteriales bacterium]WKZ68155.1 MAG: 4a-hydroxytetrahydrobiopterin dehydratase [Melioribacteraceae bacterium]